MRLNKNLFVIFLFVVILGVFSLPLFVSAQTPSSTTDLHLVFEPPCVKIGIGSIDTCDPITDIQTYIKRLYQFAVGISGIVAVGMIVYGAILIIIKSENITAKSEGRQIIQDALWGVLLLFASYILLNTINPELVKLKEPSAGLLIQKNQYGTLNQISTTTCGMSIDIEALDDNEIYSSNTNSNPQKIATKDQEPNNRCGLRRVLFQHDGEITDNGDESQNYYYENEEYDENTIAWTYPYYKKGADPKTTAKCIIYAIREPVDSDEKAKTVMVDLNSQITPCLLDDIPTSTIKDKFDVDVSRPVKQLQGWIWGNDPATRGASGTCPAEPTTGPCSVENLKKTCWGAFGDTVVSQAARICAAESGGNVTLGSTMDKCQPGNEIVSWGLFQINMSAHTPIGSTQCKDSAAAPVYTAQNHNCTTKTNYTQCKTSATTASANLQKACDIYKAAGNKWSPWGANGKCNF